MRTNNHQGTPMGMPHTDLRPWQCKGRCTDCGAKVAGWRRMKACVCGGSVRYR